MSIDPVSLAITAAITATNMVVTASRTIEGPRIRDNGATLADYGAPLNYFLGTRMLSCPCFFAKPLREKKKKRKGKGGKQVTYTAFGTWAVSVADHQIGGILQIWFDNHLVWDGTGGTARVYPLADDYELTANLRIYTGTEDQEPDPDMLAYIEARDGPGTCPAYRGMSYIYFENIPLEMLGNRYPDVKVLATHGKMIQFAGQQGVDVSGKAGMPIPFDLSDVENEKPVKGDLVIIAVSSGGYPFDDDTFHTPILGYQPLTPLYEDNNVLSRFVFRAYYKFMPDPPDEEFTPAAVENDGARNAYQIIVFRNVHPDVISGPIGVFSGVGPGSYTPEPIIINGEEFDPGDIGGNFATHKKYVFYSMAVVATNGEMIPLVLGGTSTGDGSHETAGNMIAMFQHESEPAVGTRTSRANAAYGKPGEEVLYPTIGHLLTFLSLKAGIRLSDCDYSSTYGKDHYFPGYNWTQSTGRQIVEPMLDLFDVDVRPHDFQIQALPRGMASLGAIATGTMARRDNGETPYELTDIASSDLPRRFYLTYGDNSIDQNANVAMPPLAPSADSASAIREQSLDMQTLALEPDLAQQLSERFLRRLRISRTSAKFSVSRSHLAIEPGDVLTPYFDDRAWSMRATNTTIGADGVVDTEWVRDTAALALVNELTPGAPAQGNIPDVVPSAIDTDGFVMDMALIVDAHNQTAPLLYLAAGPSEPGVWTGADFAMSETGDPDSFAEGWGTINVDGGSTIGVLMTTLAPCVPYMIDNGPGFMVQVHIGELTSASYEELLENPALNVAAVRSGDGWEIIQFMNATLVGTRTYRVTGILRGMRGTEWTMAGHTIGDDFVLLDEAIRRSVGASEIGDTDWYAVTPTGWPPDTTTAFPVLFTAAAHKPLAPVHGSVELVGDDVVFLATRRTRIGGATLNGQDVPIGETTETYSLDIIDNSTSPPSVKRTINATSLPVIYTESQQIEDWGAPLSAASPIVIPEANLYQVSPPLSLRGYPLNYPEQTA